MLFNTNMSHCCLTLTYTEHRWEAHGMHCCQETRQKSRGQWYTPCKSCVCVCVCVWGGGGSDKENAAAFAYDMYEGFQRKEPAVAVAIDLEDAYNRVQFKLLMDLLIQYGVSLTLTRWADPVGCRSSPGKNTGYAAWKPELCSSSVHNGPTTRITDLAGPLQYLH